MPSCMYSNPFATHGAAVGTGVASFLQTACELADEGPQSEQVLKKIDGVAPGV